MEAPGKDDTVEKKKELKGLGGWLILLGIGVVLSPFRLLVTTVPVYYEVFQDNTWKILTTPGLDAYHPLWAPLIIGEIIYNFIIFIASIYLIYLFFSKHYIFPRLFIAILIVSIIFIPLDASVVKIILPDEQIFDPETTIEFIRVLVHGSIWTPYLLVSKRVKATFVEKMPVRNTVDG